MRHFSIHLLLGLILNVPFSFAQTQQANDHHMKHETPHITKIKVVIENAPDEVTTNKTETLRLQLFKDNKPLTSNDLKTVHTEKIHLMIIDPTLTDYHHIHPIADKLKKDFVFNFTPKKSGAYRIWVDITPFATGKQEFLMADIGTPSKQPIINKEIKLNSKIVPYHFVLKLDGEPKVGQSVMASITITKEGKPFNRLEPVMGAFAHVVGFNANNSSIIHIHPMGKEPSNESDRGGSTLMFHIGPQKAGFVKLFAQFRMNGTDIYVPFGIMVK